MNEPDPHLLRLYPSNPHLEAANGAELQHTLNAISQTIQQSAQEPTIRVSSLWQAISTGGGNTIDCERMGDAKEPGLHASL